jgi:two-component sensor histidine kinase
VGDVESAELLNPGGWAAVLETYARCVDVAVALIDRNGVLVGEVHNPKPIWKLVRAARLEWGDGCLFCLDADRHCTAAADAERTRSLVSVRGLGGFAHTAVPIFLHNRHLGTLLAGQVFDDYPELLLLEQLAGAYNLSGQELWRLARQRIPISHASLITFGQLLGTLGQAYLQERHAVILQRELTESNQALKDVNILLNAKLAELDGLLGQKDILLNEVHHRVNNNLTVIGSLLRMQAEAFPDDRVADALRGSQLRVDAMALIHAQLYNSVDWRAVQFGAYAKVLAETLFRGYGIDPLRVQLRVEISPFELGVDKAIPAGLILNELISNTLKHAFPNGRSGFLLIEGRLLDGRVELSVQDNGVGMPGSVGQTVDPRRKSLGMTIVKVLSHQLKAIFEPAQASSAGSLFRISFPQRTLSVAASII